jgi:hypothetical protein
MNLPFCEFPKAKDSSEHGLLLLPPELPSIDLQDASKYRSASYKTIDASELSQSHLLKMAKLVASSFALNEPMTRHIHPPEMKPKYLSSLYCDYFGEAEFGPWTTENIVYWFIRLNILTIPDGTGSLNKDSIKLSLAILDDQQEPIGAAFNMTLSSSEAEIKHNNHFRDALPLYMNPIMNFIHSQEQESIEALRRKYKDFEDAYLNNQVGLHFMIARSEMLPSDDTFELFAASAEHFQLSGHKYMLVAASNQWTGAACEAVNGFRVHFLPFRDVKRVNYHATSLSEPYSSDGYISDKDRGAIFYIIKLS